MRFIPALLLLLPSDAYRPAARAPPRMALGRRDAAAATFSAASLLLTSPALAEDASRASQAGSAKIEGGGASTLQSGRVIAITRGVNLDNTDWEGKSLKGVAFQQSVVRKANFKNANLFSASFFDADLAGSTFEGADMRQVNLEMADLSDVNLSNADLTNAYTSGARDVLPIAFLVRAAISVLDSLGVLLSAQASLSMARRASLKRLRTATGLTSTCAKTSALTCAPSPKAQIRRRASTHARA